MTRQRMQQSLLICSQSLSLSEEAKCSQPFIVARGNPYEDCCFWLFSQEPPQGNLLGYGVALHISLALSRSRSEPVYASLTQAAAASWHGVKFCFASAVNSHASPNGVHHARRTQPNLFQKIRQAPRLPTLHPPFH